MTAIGRPNRLFVVTTVSSQLNVTSFHNIHHENIEIARQSLSPGKRDQSPVWTPRGAYRFSAFRHQAANVGSFVVHDINLRASAAIRDKCQLAARLGVPNRRDVNSATVG